MELIYTDDEFNVHGVPTPGIPFLIDREMELVDVPNSYLYYVAVIKGRTHSPKTWKTYSRDLHDYFSFLEENDLKWDHDDQNILASYRNGMIERGLVASTINQRIRTVSRFYQWAVQQKILQSFPFSKDDIIVSKTKGFFAHVDASGNRFEANNLTLRTHKKLPEWIEIGKALIFISALSPRRNQLVAFLMLGAGLRLGEAVGLDTRVLVNPAGHQTGDGIKVNMNPDKTQTKGNKERWVLVPYDLAVGLWNYYLWERPQLAKLYKLKYDKETTKLFLNAQGEPLSEKGLENQFNKISRKTKIKVTPHMLRHTYATYEVKRISEVQNKEGALMWVRDRLGHSSIQTTEIYIHAASLLDFRDIDEYQSEICAMLRGEGGNDAAQTQKNKP